MSSLESVLDIKTPMPVLKCDKFVAICYPIEFSIHNFSYLNVSDDFQSPSFSFGNNGEYRGRILLYPRGDCVRNCRETPSSQPPTNSFCIYLQYSGDERNEYGLQGAVTFSIKREDSTKATLGTYRESTMHNTNGQSFCLCGICSCSNFNLFSHLHRNDSLRVSCEITLPIEVKLAALEKPLEVESPIPPGESSDDISCIIHDMDLADVTLVIGKEKLRVHKVVLAARSPKFEEIFNSEMPESERYEVQIVDIDFEVVKSLLVYLYTDNVPKLDTLAEGLLAAADMYQLEELKAKCEAALTEGLNVENAARTYLCAGLHHAERLKNNAINFIVENSAAVRGTEGWNTVKKEHPFIHIVPFL